MPRLMNPETGEIVRASRKGADILRDEQGYVDAEPSAVVGGPAGVPAAETIIVDNLRASDWNAASAERLHRFVQSGGRRYAEAVREYEKTHQDRGHVLAIIDARLNELPADEVPSDDDEPSDRPAKSASREDWNAYAETLGLDPDDYSSKDDLIDAVDEAEDSA